MVSLPRGPTTPCGPGPPHYRGFKITLRHYNWSDSSAREISPTQSPVSDNTEHLLETDVHAAGRIRTSNPIKRVVAALDRVANGFGQEYNTFASA
jgi:hypothetical protein